MAAETGETEETGRFDSVLANQVEILSGISQEKTPVDKPDRSSRPFHELKSEWESFYFRVYGLEVDFTDVKISKAPENIRCRLLIIMKGFTPAHIIAKKQSNCVIRVDPLIKLGDIEVRPDSSHKTIAIWVVDAENPDIRAESHSTMKRWATETLTVRLIHGLKVYDERRTYLDYDLPTITASYPSIGKNKAFVVYMQNGGMFICLKDQTMRAGGRRVFE